MESFIKSLTFHHFSWATSNSETFFVGLALDYISEGLTCDCTSNTTCGSNYTVTTNVADTAPTTTCANAAAANYSFTYVSGTVTVTQRQVTVTAQSPTVFYGAPVPTIGFTLANMANSQTETVFSTQPTCTTAYTNTDTVAMRPTSVDSGCAIPDRRNGLPGHEVG